MLALCGMHRKSFIVSTDAGARWSLIPLGGWRIFDFLQVGGQLFATDIWSSHDGAQWEPVLRFSANAPARAFERLGGDLYLGLGGPRPAEDGDCAPFDEILIHAGIRDAA